MPRVEESDPGRLLGLASEIRRDRSQRGKPVLVAVGQGFDIDTNGLGPAVVRPNRNYRFDIYWGNAGDLDAMSPLLIVDTVTGLGWANLRVVTSGRNEGKGAAVRRGLAAARGRAVRLELDDLALLPQGSILHWKMSHFVVLDRVRRGGAWDDDGRGCRSAYRDAYAPGVRYVDRQAVGCA
mgnify:CR=1 FL=1